MILIRLQLHIPRFTMPIQTREKVTVFGSQINLARATNRSLKHVNRYLNSSENYTKLKLTRKWFPGLRVISCRLNEVWSIDLADMQQTSIENSGVRYLFVAVDTLSQFLCFVGVKPKTSKACSYALKEHFSAKKHWNAPKICAAKKIPEWYGLIKVKSLLLNSQCFAKSNVEKFTLHETRQNRLWLRDTYEPWKLKSSITFMRATQIDTLTNLKSVSQSLPIKSIVWLSWLQSKNLKKTFHT